MQRILFIAPTRIGDAVLASSVLAHIMVANPAARVTIATSPLAAPLYAGYPLLQRIIPMTKQPYNRHWLKLWREVGLLKWDEVWDIRGSIISYLLRRRKLKSFIPPKNGAPKVEQYATAFSTGKLPYPTLWPQVNDSKAAEELLPSGDNYLVIAPTANYLGKEWPSANFIAASKALLSGACAGHRPVIVCAGHERERALPLLEALKDHRPIDLTEGKLPLLTVFACMKRAHGFIGNDSGLMHMAAASGIPTLGIFGPTPSAIYQPWGPRAAFLQSVDGTMETISPAAVVDNFTKLLVRN